MTRLSLAKEKVRILLLEGIYGNAAADLAAAGYAVSADAKVTRVAD